MKRKPYVDPLPNHMYGRAKTWFEWHECKLCGLEFRRENGWWIRSLNNICHPSSWLSPEYICGDCIKSEEDMITYLKDRETKRAKPPK